MALSIARKKELIKLVREVTGLPFRYSFANIDYSAYVYPASSFIVFAKVKKQKWQSDTEEEFIGDIMHELVHIHYYNTGKFKAYHRDPTTRAQKIAYICTAWRAEKNVDKYAKLLTKKFFGLKYKLVYTDKKDSKGWFDKEVLEPLRKEWGIGKYGRQKRRKRST